MSQFHKLKVSDIKRETSDSVSVEFEVPSSLKDVFSFIPGQYLTINIAINGEDCRRAYSICSSSNGAIRVAVKKVDNGKMSTYLNKNLSISDMVDVMEPQGSFILNTEKGVNKYVAFAAGSGITPIMSMIKEIAANSPNSSFLLFYSNKTEDEVIFKRELDQLKSDTIQVNYIYTQQKGDDKLHTGRIDSKKAKKLMKSEKEWLNADAFYLCGPEQMILDIKDSLQGLGVMDGKIKYELFTTPVLMANDNNSITDKETDDFEGEAIVKVIYDDEEAEFTLQKDGDTILDAAMEEDLDVPFSCKGAVCCTCKAKVIEGKVTMDANYSLTDKEVEDGYILACQSHPASSRVVVDFD